MNEEAGRERPVSVILRSFVNGAAAMSASARIFLIGPMGSGKTTIGQKLAAELKLEFVDADRVIEERCGADVAWIFDKEGEEGFREREERVIGELTQRDGIVLATGGGAVLRAANRRALAGRGTVIYLHASAEQQLERTRQDRNRPLLRTPNPAKTLRDLMTTRAPLYRQTADLTIDATNHPAHSIVKAILQELELRGAIRT